MVFGARSEAARYSRNGRKQRTSFSPAGPTISQMWRRNWEHLTPFFAYPADIRKVIYTTNALSGENFIEHQARRIEVALDAGILTRELLRRHVRGRSVSRFFKGKGARHTRQAEIGDTHLAAAVNHDVGRLQVAVNDAMLVCGREAGADLPCHFDGLIRR
jgi:hypothetical protein